MTHKTRSEHLNHECFCITLDRDALCRALEKEVADDHFCAMFVRTRPHLFSSVPVFLSAADVDSMFRTVQTIEAMARSPGYQKRVLSWAPEIAHREFGSAGVFMGYDFHLGAEGPKLIEINTNAGGAFLNAVLAKAQRACCPEIEIAMARSEADDFELAVLRMFENEWTLQHRSGKPRRIAIVDDHPREQYLYPEFLVAQRFFIRHGIEAIVADAGELRYGNGRLSVGEQAIDLVYNRLVDFDFGCPEHDALRRAYRDGSVVVTPNPRVHAIFADKRNLTLLSDQAALHHSGISPEQLTDLARVPRTLLVSAENAQQLWQNRKQLFFKPSGGHGGKAVYRGDKMTKGVWAEIVRGGYVAQEFAAPSERLIKLDGAPARRKMDVRLYTYDGQILLMGARLYQGQTTNFRTPGGGFAPVFAI
jgi:hypothetical protein